MGRIRIAQSGGIQDGFESFTWDIVFPASASSIAIPQTKGLPYLASAAMEIDVELYDRSDFGGYEGFLAAYRATDGRFDQATLAGGDRLDIGVLEASAFQFFVTNDALGTVTYDLGAGPVTVANDDQIVVPNGAQVVVTATANNGGVVSELFSDQGTTTGVGTQTATLTIDSSETGSFIDVFFSAP